MKHKRYERSRRLASLPFPLTTTWAHQQRR